MREPAGDGERYSILGRVDRSHDEARRPPQRDPVMAHEIAKLLLEKAGTFLQRTQAIEAAMQLGMPLNEIEEYLDWLDAVRGPVSPDDEPNNPGESSKPRD
jgi:hypothetical protein